MKITISGVQGEGKTKVARAIAEMLVAGGIPVHLVSERERIVTRVPRTIAIGCPFDIVKIVEEVKRRK
jgi:thymidylate kinase